MSGRNLRSSATDGGRKKSGQDTTVVDDGPPPKKARGGQGSAAFSAFFKSYKGLDDYHIPVFKDVLKLTSAEKVLYPGCHRHITASLIFPDVVYVDFYSKVEAVFKDQKALEYVEKNKIYSSPAMIKFKLKDFTSDLGEKSGSFDLLISLNAGIVTTSCTKYVKPGGYILAGDGHFDARQAFVNKNLQLVGVYDDELKKFDQSKEGLEGHFTTKDGKKMTQAMVDESIAQPKAKRSFKLTKEAMFYLFKKMT